MLIKEKIKQRFPSLTRYYYFLSNRERRVSYGNDNPDKVFYVYGVPDTVGGLWWHINKVLMHLGYAKDNGYIPVVDMQNYESQYLCKEELGKTNVWEVFFKQPAGYSLEDIKNSKNIILGRKLPYPRLEYYMGQSPFYENEDRIKYFHNLFQEYIVFNDRTTNYLDELHNTMFGDKGRIVGVLCRGTDYMQKKPRNHPVQPNPLDVIRDTKEVMNKYNCDYVFVATEDADILDVFKNEFGRRLLYIEQTRLRKQDITKNDYLSSAFMRLNQSNDIFHRCIDYLSATFLLSKCNCYIAGRTGGSKGVLIMSNGFEFKKIYDLGLY